MLSYLHSRLSGFVGAVVVILGVVVSVAPTFLPFVPTKDKETFGAAITILGAIKTWIAPSPTK